MKITKVEALHLRLPEVHQIFDGSQEVLLARAVADAGLEDYGEVVSRSPVARDGR